MNPILKYPLISLVLVVLFSCEKKVSIKIKEQAKEYPVIFGIISNDVNERTVSVSASKSFSDNEAGKPLDVVLKMQSAWGEQDFSRNPDHTYRLDSVVRPYMPYNFVCTYKSVAYSYSVFTDDFVEIDSVQCLRQPDGSFMLNATLYRPFPFSFMANILVQVQIGMVDPGSSKTDTIWKKYNERFPQAIGKMDFLSARMIVADSSGRLSYEIVRDAPLSSNDLVKVEIYAIDFSSVEYLSWLQYSNDAIYDPLALSPPENYFAFSNNALGIIIPALKTSKIFRVP